MQPSTAAEQPHRVLVVDDEPNIVDVISMALRFQGFAVQSAGTGRDALAAVRSFDPHLMVLDIMLPDMEGFEVAERLGAQRAQVPIIFLTARRHAGQDPRADERRHARTAQRRSSTATRRSCARCSPTSCATRSCTPRPARGSTCSWAPATAPRRSWCATSAPACHRPPIPPICSTASGDNPGRGRGRARFEVSLPLAGARAADASRGSAD